MRSDFKLTRTKTKSTCRFRSWSRYERTRGPLRYSSAFLRVFRCGAISLIKASRGSLRGRRVRDVFAPALTELDVKSTGAPSVLRDSSKSDPTFFFFLFTHVITQSHSSPSSLKHSPYPPSCTVFIGPLKTQLIYHPHPPTIPHIYLIFAHKF